MKQLVNIWVQFNNGEERSFKFETTSSEPENWWFPITRPKNARRIEVVEVETSGGARVQWYRAGVTVLYHVQGNARDVSGIADGYVKVKDKPHRQWQIWANLENLSG